MRRARGGARSGQRPPRRPPCRYRCPPTDWKSCPPRSAPRSRQRLSRRGTFSIFGCVPHAMSAAEHSTRAKSGRKRFMAVLREEEQQRRLACFFAASGQRSAPPPFFAGCGLFSTLASAVSRAFCGGLRVELGQFRIEAQKMPQKRKGYAPQGRGGGLSPANAALYGATARRRGAFLPRFRKWQERLRSR